jgi:RNA polymerase sigma factor (sigma-70 family)
VNPKSYELDKQHAFDAFCKKVLRNDVRNYYVEMKRLRDKEVSFSELSAQELEQLSTTDKYFSTEQTFNVLGDDIIVNDESIAEALRSLPERKRDIILLSYFLELSDGEIGTKLNLIRSTVQYQRTSTLRELKKMMEEETANERQNQDDK